MYKRQVQGQTSSVHVASLSPAKDLASMYVSATRGRDRTLFVVDARDYLTDSELVHTQTWKPADLDDEVLDRVKTALAKRIDRIDSPREHLRAAGHALEYSRPRRVDSAGMALGG